MYSRKGNHIITTKTEHKAVLDSCTRIEKMGGEITYLNVKEDGLVDLAELEAAIKPTTILVSIMWANNETGVIQDMKAIGQICEKHGVLLMSDATQAVGKIPVHPKEVGVHLLAFTAHKMYGPKGVGALYVCRKNPRVKVTAQMDGGGHERGMRSGTLNVPGIVGFGKAAEIAKNEMAQDAERLSRLRDKLEIALRGNLEEVYINGNTEHRMPHVTNLSFKHVEGEGLMMTFNQNIAVSSGSACTSASLEPSYVLVALGLGDDLAHSSIRFSLGRFTTEEEVDFAVQAITAGVNHMRDLSPIWEMYKEGIDVNSIVWESH
jgi:cysteine desulfurase